MKQFVEFYNKKKVPILGLGTWQASNPAELETALDAALDIGYRHFDTAFNYQNEDVFGRVLKRWFETGKVKREELFITTKLPMIAMQPERVSVFLQKSLTALQLEYVDLYLVHAPVGFQYFNDTDLFPIRDGKTLIDMTTDLEAIWKEMENQVDAGKTKAIGISNFNSAQIQRMINIARIPPANLQVELNVSFQQKPLREFCAKNNITVCAYAPFGSPGRKALYEKRGLKDFKLPQLLEDPVVGRIAQKYNKTPAQTLLRFLAQQDIIVIPKSVTAERLKKNREIFDFELDPSDMKELESLDQGAAARSFSFVAFPGSEVHPENPYRIPF